MESGAVARYGRYAFEVRGAAVGGMLRGLCRYGREEAGLRMNDVTIATPSAPLALDCAFDDATGRIGEMEVDAEWPRGAVLTARAGRVRVGAAVLDIRSAHLGEQVRGPVDEPLGYVFSTPGGATAGAAELPSGGRARLALSRDPAARRAALAAGIALALFWDPGDTD